MLSTKVKENVKLILIILGMLLLASLVLFISTKENNYVSAVDLEGQNNVIPGTSYLTFDAGFGANSDAITHSAVIDVDTQEPKLYLKLLTTAGGCTVYNPTFQFLTETGGYNINFDIGFGSISLKDSETNEEIVRSSSDADKTVCLKDLNGGMIISLRARPDFENCAQTNQTCIVRFTGTLQDPSGNVTPVSKDIYINIGWTASHGMELEQRITTYTRNGKTDTLTIETSIQNQIRWGSSKYTLPVKQTQLVVDVPTYQGIAPDSVKVTASRTSATNGKDETNVVFDNSNWSYNSTNRKLTITVNNNPDALGNIAYGRGSDEYKITYIYPKAAYDAFAAGGTTILNKVSGTMTLYANTSTTTVTAVINKNESLKGEFGGTSDALTKIAPYINAIIGEDEWWSNRGRILSYTVSNAESVAAVRMEFGEMRFYAGSTVYSGFNSARNKNCNPITVFSIPETSFKEFLGNSGYVKIYDDGMQHLIGQITTSTTKNADGEYEVKIPESYQNSSRKLILETSKPQTNLKTLEIYYNREVKGGVFTLKQAQEMTRADAELNMYTARPEDPTNFTLDKDAPLIIDEVEYVDSYTNASLTVETAKLDASNPNEQELNLKVLLDNIRDDTDVWYEPYFDIEFPSYITEISSLQFQGENFEDMGFDKTANKLQVHKVDGKLHFMVSFEGVQWQFKKVSALKVNAKVKVDKFAPNTTEDITVRYINKGVKSYKTETNWLFTSGTSMGLPAGNFAILPNGTKAGVATGTIDFENTPTLLCISEIAGYDGEKTINSVENRNTAAQIPVNTAMSPTMSLKIQNNHAVPASNISILGRIPYTNNKYVIANADLGTNINTQMSRKLTTTSGKDITIYYSDNLDATKDVTLASNNWKTDVADLSKVRSYLIVINDTMAPGEQINFSYQFDIPAGVTYNKSLYASFGAYYDAGGETLNCETDKIGLTTKREGDINVQKAGSIIVGDGENAKEGDVIEYKIQIQNESEEAINNVVIKDKIPENTIYATKNEAGEYVKDPSVKEITENIGTINANETKVYTFYVIVDEIAENTNIQNTATITVDGFDPIPSNPTSIPAIKSQTKEPFLEVVKTSSIPAGSKVKEGDIITYKITVKNTGLAPAKNVKITDKIPEGTVYYDLGTNTANPDIRSVNSDVKEILNTGESFSYEFEVQVGKVEAGTKIKNTAIVIGENVPDKQSNTEEIETIEPPEEKTNLRVEKTSSIEEGKIVKEGDQITYTITVYNDGEVAARNVEIKDKVPAHTSYYENGKKDKSKVDVGKTIDVIQPGKSVKYSFTVVVEEIPQNTTIQNTASVKAENAPEIKSNTVGIKAEISEPQLELTKTSNIEEGKTLVNGDIIEYTITVTNIGDCVAHNVIITDEIPEYTIYVEKAGERYIKDASRRKVTKTIETLEPGESQTLILNVMVSALNSNVQITNTAKVNANNGNETSSNTVGISAKPKETTKGGDIPDTGEYSLIIILVISIVALGGFVVSEYKRMKRKR